MAWHDETPWARKRRQTAEAKAARETKEARVEQIRHALASYDRGGCSLERFLQDVSSIAIGGVVKVGESHKPEVQG